jgi:uncharacterized protein with ParB-like and HNH nuclease domain
MAQIDVKNAFDPSTVSIYEYFQSRGVGFYIPHYQREYSWGSENIDQLLLDIEIGVETLLKDKDEFRFLGTVITVKELNNNNIDPIEEQALPSTIQNVIDGQQRLSTLAVFSTVLYDSIEKIKNRIPSSSKNIDQLKESCGIWQDKLIDIFSFELRKNISRKPKIIRASEDQWTIKDDLEKCYKSDVSNYLAKFIEYIDDDAITNRPSAKGELLPKNIAKIDNWITKKVLLAHTDQNIEFSNATDLINILPEENLWDYSHPELKVEILKNELDKKSDSFLASQLIQLFSACHYLLERCCLTVIVPGKTEWAFDLFQSLNATGTPLTAIETFLPTVVSFTKLEEKKYKGSEAEANFEKINHCLVGKSAGEKNKRTNDFLTSIRICIDGEKLAGQFSQQRIWLEDLYSKQIKTYLEKKELISLFGQYATFISDVWQYDAKNNISIKELEGPDRDVTSLLIRYLISVNHKMSITILALSYRKILNKEKDAEIEFTKTVKLIAIFYTMWRSVRSNSGLDNVYRNYFKGIDGQNANNWLKVRSLNYENLNEYLNNVLVEECKIKDKKSWSDKAINTLKYNSSGSNLCKFILLVCAHDTTVDPDNIGQIIIAMPNTSNYFNLEKWESSDLESVEHIAPQENKSNWDSNLYLENDELFHSIGNLTLLPKHVNSSAGNRPWKEKFMYFSYINVVDPSELKKLEVIAKKEKLKLSASTIELLKKVGYNNHVKSILSIGIDGNWTAELVKQRSSNLIDIFWDKTHSWLVK